MAIAKGEKYNIKYSPLHKFFFFPFQKKDGNAISKKGTHDEPSSSRGEEVANILTETF